LRDVAYGTRQYTIKPSDDEVCICYMMNHDMFALCFHYYLQILAQEDFEDPVELENGQNLFEIHIRRVCTMNIPYSINAQCTYID
jgi:hypothetical protein